MLLLISQLASIPPFVSHRQPAANQQHPEPTEPQGGIIIVCTCCCHARSRSSSGKDGESGPCKRAADWRRIRRLLLCANGGGGCGANVRIQITYTCFLILNETDVPCWEAEGRRKQIERRRDQRNGRTPEGPRLGVGRYKLPRPGESQLGARSGRTVSGPPLSRKVRQAAISLIAFRGPCSTKGNLK